MTCIRVHELVCVFSPVPGASSQGKDAWISMDSLKGGACVWGQAVVLGEGELDLFT